MATRRQLAEHDASLREQLQFLIDNLAALVAGSAGVFATRNAPSKERAAGQKVVGAQLALLLPADTTRRNAALVNLGPDTVYLGTRDLAADSGCPLAAGQPYTDTCVEALYAICAAGDTATVGWIAETGTHR